MAKTIGQLTQATTLASGDEFIIEQSGLTKRVAASVVRGGLVNADIDAAAAIAFSKLAALDDANLLVGNGSNVATKVAVTGDVTISNAGVTAIGSSKVVTAMVNNGAITAAKLDGAQTGSAPIYGCRAWVNFDAGKDSTGASNLSNTNRFIRASGNVSTVLKNGTGDYTISFTTAMPDAGYVITGTASNAVDDTSLSAVEPLDITTARSASSFRISCAYVNSTTNRTLVDPLVASVAIFR
jgi:hypothetical protein